MAKHEYTEDGPLPPSAAVGHETTDAEAGPVLKFLLVLGIVTIVTAGLVILFYNYLERREASEKTARYPLASGRTRPLPPQPRLQTYPFDDIKELRRSELSLLDRYAWVDKNRGVVRIPIERAMELIAERGLPYRAAPAGEAKSAGASASARALFNASYGETSPEAFGVGGEAPAPQDGPAAPAPRSALQKGGGH